MPPRNPFPTVDVVIELPGDRVVLIDRKNPPLGRALPGGFVDYGESLETAARREAEEETGLDVTLVALLGAYSAPDRDPRQHTLSVAYVARADAEPVAGDDAAAVHVIPVSELADQAYAFDHGLIVSDYLRWRETGACAPPREGAE